MCFPNPTPPCLFQVAEELAARKEAEQKEKNGKYQEKAKEKKPEKAGKEVRP